MSESLKVQERSSALCFTVTDIAGMAHKGSPTINPVLLVEGPQSRGRALLWRAVCRLHRLQWGVDQESLKAPGGDLQCEMCTRSWI